MKITIYQIIPELDQDKADVYAPFLFSKSRVSITDLQKFMIRILRRNGSRHTGRNLPDIQPQR